MRKERRQRTATKYEHTHISSCKQFEKKRTMDNLQYSSGETAYSMGDTILDGKREEKKTVLLMRNYEWQLAVDLHSLDGHCLLWRHKFAAILFFFAPGVET